MQRLQNSEECKKITRKYPRYFTFDEEAWFRNSDNYALIEGENIGFAEYKKPGIYWVHFCFHTAKGREAIDLTRRMLSQLWEERPVKHVIGLIELENKPARWLIRQVGLTSLGEVMTHNGMCEMFYKKEK